MTPESPPPAAGTSDAPSGRPRKGILRRIFLITAALAAAGWLAGYIHHALHYEETDDAFVAGHLHQISPRVAGTVQEVFVHENDRVAAGQALARLDSEEFEISRQRCRAELERARAAETQARAAESQASADTRQAVAKLHQAEAQLGQANAQLELTTLNETRIRSLFSQHDGAVSKADLDQSHSALAAARAAVDAATANRDAARDAIESARAAAEAAKARSTASQAGTVAAESACRDADRLLSYATVHAPAAGRVGAKSVESGNRVQPGQQLMVITGDDVWITANFKETQLARMSPGQKVDIRIDALPGHLFHGTVDSLAPASGAQYALLPPDNATGNFTKVVQRVPVKIFFDADSIGDLRERIRPGLSVVVDVAVR